MKKILFRGNRHSKKNEGYIFVISIFILASISFIVLGISEIINIEYKSAIKKSNSFYETILEENENVKKEK